MDKEQTFLEQLKDAEERAYRAVRQAEIQCKYAWAQFKTVQGEVDLEEARQSIPPHNQE